MPDQTQEQKQMATDVTKQAINGLFGSISNAAQFTAVGASIVINLVLLLIVLPSQTELVNHQSERMSALIDSMGKVRLEETIERRDDKRATFDEIRENRASQQRSQQAAAEQAELTRRQIDMLAKTVMELRAVETETQKSVLEIQRTCGESAKVQQQTVEALKLVAEELKSLRKAKE